MLLSLCFVFFNVTATTAIYTYLHPLSLHDALPILLLAAAAEEADAVGGAVGPQRRDLECGACAADGHAEHAAGQWPGQFRGEHAVEADLLDIRHGGGSCAVGVRARRGRCFRRPTRGAHPQTTQARERLGHADRKSTRLNSSH